jgi:hypothetical protein
MIQPETVEREMSAAGYHLWFRGPRLAPDRFLLVFGKTQADKVSPEADPFVGGPKIDRPPGQWLQENYWRLRGLKTTDGRFARLTRKAKDGEVQIVPVSSDGKDDWQITIENLRLRFQQTEKEYSVESFRLLDGKEVPD